MGFCIPSPSPSLPASKLSHNVSQKPSRVVLSSVNSILYSNFRRFAENGTLSSHFLGNITSSNSNYDIKTYNASNNHTAAAAIKESRGPNALSAYRRTGFSSYKEQLQPDAPKVEQGVFSYELENVINELSALAPRGSIARCMEAYKSKFTIQDFSLIFREFAKRGDWQRAYRLFRYMQRQAWCRPSEHIYTIMIGIMGREGMLDRASELFEEMPENNVSWNVYSFTALINAFGRNGQYEMSLDLLERMKRERVMPNVITYNTILNACSKGGIDWEGLLDLFAQMRHEGIQPDLITYNTLLTACCARNLVEAAGMVFRSLNDAGVVPDTLSYSTLVDTYEREGQLSTVQTLLKEMEENGNVPEVVGYNALIDAYRRSGEHKEAEKVLEQMQSAGCAPNVDTYSMLLETYGEHGCYSEVREMFTEMKERGIEPDVITYNTLVDVFGKGGHFKEAVSLLKDMTEGGIEPDMSTYSGLLFACGKGGLYNEARDIYRHMQINTIIPSEDMFVSLINAYGKSGLYTEAASTLQTMSDSGVSRTVEAYNALLDAYAKGGLRIPAAHTFMDMMENQSLEPNVNTLNSMIETCGRAGQFNESMGVYQDLLKAGYEPNEGTQSTLIAVYCAAGMLEEARAQFLEMQAEGFLPEASTYCLLLSLFARRNRWEDGGRLLEEMRSFRMPAEHQFLRSLALGEFDFEYTWQIVDRFVDETKVEGVGKNLVLWNSVLEMLWHMGTHKRASRFLDTIQKKGVFPRSVEKSNSIWAVDLHRMSIGGSMVLLNSWLQEMKFFAENGEQFPPLISIVTKWGYYPEASSDLTESPVRKLVHNFLLKNGSPFKLATWNHGRLISRGSDVQEWLLLPDTTKKLTLVDSILPIGSSNSSSRTGNSNQRASDSSMRTSNSSQRNSDSSNLRTSSSSDRSDTSVRFGESSDRVSEDRAVSRAVLGTNSEFNSNSFSGGERESWAVAS